MYHASSLMNHQSAKIYYHTQRIVIDFGDQPQTRDNNSSAVNSQIIYGRYQKLWIMINQPLKLPIPNRSCIIHHPGSLNLIVSRHQPTTESPITNQSCIIHHPCSLSISMNNHSSTTITNQAFLIHHPWSLSIITNYHSSITIPNQSFIIHHPWSLSITTKTSSINHSIANSQPIVHHVPAWSLSNNINHQPPTTRP